MLFQSLVPQLFLVTMEKAKIGQGKLVRGNIKIEKVSLVDGLKHSLLSISQFCDKGMHCIFTSTNCYIKCIDTSETILTGIRKGNVYAIDLNKINRS